MVRIRQEVACERMVLWMAVWELLRWYVEI
jgi:hypothetical protein